MMKMSNKIIGIISGSSAAVIAGTTVTANVLIKKEEGKSDNTNPLDRDKSYHHYPIANKLANSTNLNNLIGFVKNEQTITYIIEETKFVSNIKQLVWEALKSIPTFADNYLNYVIKCNYKINTKSVLVDLVWYEPEAKNKFFDQFEIMLQSA